MRQYINRIEQNKGYTNMLRMLGQLSNLFSSNNIPYIHYRMAEKVFCKYFHAIDLSRLDIAYDAQIGNKGIGIKTFILDRDTSIEKIAEFNRLSPALKDLDAQQLAIKLGEYRNERIRVTNEVYNISEAVYHIIGRKNNALQIFETPYDFVDIKNINVIKNSLAGIQFSDGKNYYNFNKSKSVLMQQFCLPDKTIKIPIKILDDPYALLESLLEVNVEEKPINNHPCIILPLYSTSSKTREVPLKSGLNQWNAKGRPRDPDEIYIPIPHKLHVSNPDFFPSRKDTFYLKLPDGTVLNAKLCQDNAKALMSNPNRDLGKWLLRKVLNLKEGTVVTRHILDRAGFDSVILYKDEDKGGTPTYSIDVSYLKE